MMEIPIIAAVFKILIFLIVLSVLIVVHEWGHFITAKRLGVQVDEFALGFGPTLYSRHFNGTNYLIKLYPLGGYVKMAGDERDKCTGAPEEFYSKPVSHRALVVLNGPVVNFIFAYICYVFVFLIGYPGVSTKVAEILEGSPAMEAGLQVGDEITKIDSKKLYGMFHLERVLEGSEIAPVEVTYLRDGQELSTTVIPKIEKKPNLIGRERDVRELGVAFSTNKVGGFTKNSPAQAAGLEIEDHILEIDSTRIYDWTDVQTTIANSKSDTVSITVLRDGAEITKVITPKIIDEKNAKGEKVQRRIIGIGPLYEFGAYSFGLTTAVSYSFSELMFITTITYEALYRMATGAVSAKESVAGPIGIFYIVDGAASRGIAHLLLILAIISASLAIFNLLPFIPLDGGHLFLMGIEKIRGKALSPKTDEMIARFGFSLIICLAIFVFYADMLRYGWIDGILSLWK